MILYLNITLIPFYFLKQVYTRLEKTGLCLSRMGTWTLIDMLGRRHDEEVMKWVTALQVLTPTSHVSCLAVHVYEPPEMEESFKSIRLGITNIPPLLQPNRTADLETTIQLHRYEIAPCKPLHDLKGHFANIIDETEHLLSGNALNAFKQIKAASLDKTTLRCSDYRRAMILIYLKLQEFNIDQAITEIFQTGVHISHLLYTHEYNREPSAVLALHNTTFLHGLLCSQVFQKPVTMTTL